MGKFVDLTGQKFNRWTVIKRFGKSYPASWLCRCDCGLERAVLSYNLRRNRTKSCSCLNRELARDRGKQKINENNPMWKGDKIGNAAVHMWLRAKFGTANLCENKKCFYPRLNCKGKTVMGTKNFNWAKIRGKEYKRKRENFVMLCRSCHTSYDCSLQKAQNRVVL